MMQKIKNNIFSVGADDPDRKLFDALIPLPRGTTYNSYLIRGSRKTALIDTVDPSKSDILLSNLEKANVNKIDYVIANHAEQDHSGSLPLLIKNFPEAKIICSDKCKPLLMDFLHIPENKLQTVKDQETMDLGDKTIEFIHIPWVHWPETMVTYIKEDKILFSCDFFGSHFASDNLLIYDKNELDKAAKSYFAEIMMPFRAIIKNNIIKLDNYDVEMIAPSHGPIRSEPETILNYYKEWTSDKVKNLVIIAYVSMHGSTKIIADRLSKSLIENGVKAHEYNISEMDLGEIAADLLDAATIVIGTPCLLGGIHPNAASLIYLSNALRPKTKYVSIIGSFGWSGGIAEAIEPMIKNLKVEIIPPVIIKGLPNKKDFNKIEKLALAIASKHKELSLM
jgi:flavorubredoxin